MYTPRAKKENAQLVGWMDWELEKSLLGLVGWLVSILGYGIGVLCLGYCVLCI